MCICIHVRGDAAAFPRFFWGYLLFFDAGLWVGGSKWEIENGKWAVGWDGGNWGLGDGEGGGDGNLGFLGGDYGCFRWVVLLQNVAEDLLKNGSSERVVVVNILEFCPLFFLCLL